MDARFSRASVTGRDPHRWHNYERYRIVHDQRLADHAFIDQDRPDTLVFDEVEGEGVVRVHIEGEVYCKEGLTLKVEKWFDTRMLAGRLQVKGDRYRYIGYVRGDEWVLKYHNLHDDKNEYIHRVRNPETDETESETLTRNQFPIMTDVLDELKALTLRSDA